MAHHTNTHTERHGSIEERWPSEHHIMPVKTYLAVFAGLIVLTVATVSTAKGVRLHPHELNIALAMIIAFCKAVLVVLFFMHQKFETRANRLIFIAAFVGLALLLGLTGLDLMTRVNFKQDPQVFETLKAAGHEPSAAHGATGEAHGPNEDGQPMGQTAPPANPEKTSAEGTSGGEAGGQHAEPQNTNDHH